MRLEKVTWLRAPAGSEEGAVHLPGRGTLQVQDPEKRPHTGPAWSKNSTVARALELREWGIAVAGAGRVIGEGFRWSPWARVPTG